jgi:hypothetical protein
MQHGFYSYQQLEQTRYSFISSGRQSIQKIVSFTPTFYPNVLNLGFGDVMADGTLDDKRVSDNGDISIVMATVIQIIENFISENPHISIYFRGNTDQRNLLYQRVLKIYYNDFKEKYTITALIKDINGYKEVVFNVDEKTNYFAFLIKKNI